MPAKAVPPHATTSDALNALWGILGPVAAQNGFIAAGERNSGLASIAGAMRRVGQDQGSITHALLAFNAAACRPPLPDAEVATIAASIARYAPAAQPVGLSDDDLALEFSAQHADDWRYVAAWGRWLRWDGHRWHEEHTLLAYDQARAVCRAAAARVADKPGTAARLKDANTTAAVERLARADRRHAATDHQWDQDDCAINAHEKYIDLRDRPASNGVTIRDHARTDYMTKMAGANPGAACPHWLNFLEDITRDDVDMQAYLQRAAGYCLTGLTYEHVMFFLYGTGANGKSVFLNTLAAVWGDYACGAPIDAFLESKSDRHPTELAKLRGVRLVIVNEVSQGRRWDESKIKALTSGDLISARFMRQDFFDFKPQFKLMIAGNNKPALRGVDLAMRRRIHIIPFTVTVPKERQDPQLTEKLYAERDGILNWAIQGCVRWQRQGLNPPTVVRAATEEYFATEDAIGRWTEECCTLQPNAAALTSDLFASWRYWAEQNGEYVGSVKKLSQELEKRGYIKRAFGHQKKIGFLGIGRPGINTESPE